MSKEKRYRDAGTGEYVTEEYAAEHPDTTVSEEAPDEDTTDANSDLGVLRSDAIPE